MENTDLENTDILFYVDHSKIRIARKKRQNYLKDYHKRLLHLSRRERKLCKLERELPLVPLEQPYQKGWVRFFVLRDDVRRSVDAEFFTQLLSKINTEIYSSNKKFYFKKGKSRFKYTYNQSFKSFSESQWLNPLINTLTEREKSYFSPMLLWDEYGKQHYIKYVFTEAWRYVLRIKPNYITHRRGLDPDLKSEIKEIENFLDGRYLRSVVFNKFYGQKYNWQKSDKPDDFKNRTFASIIDEYNENLI